MSRNPTTEKKLRIFIVDDEMPSRLRLKNLLDDLAPTMPLEVVGEAGDGVEAMEKIIQQIVDVVLVDIRMPRMDGLELALHLMGLERSPAVVFVTTYDQYAVKAFELEALDYILKPVKLERLSEALRRAHPSTLSASALRNLCPDGRTHLRCIERNRILLVPVTEILYLKAEDKYTVARTWERSYLLNETLLKLEEEFGPMFIRLRRNCLAAREAITGFVREKGDAQSNRWVACFRGIPDEVLIGRRLWPDVKESMKHKFGNLI